MERKIRYETQVAVVCLLTLYAVPGAASCTASEADRILKTMLILEFGGDLHWERTERDNRIVETAMIDGELLNFIIYESSGRAYALSADVPLWNLKWNNDKRMSGTLAFYNILLQFVTDEMPYNSIPREIFSPDNIQLALTNGYSYTGEYLQGGWYWPNKGPAF